jgi:MFS family permease
MDDSSAQQPESAATSAGGGVARAASGTWVALRHDTFRSFWFFSFLAFIGASLQNVGAGWLMVDLGGSPLQVSLIQGAMSLSVVLLSLVSGAFADLHDRRRIMLYSLTGLMLCTGAIGALEYLGYLTPITLLAITFVFGLASAGMTPAMQSTFPDLVSREALPSAVTLNGMSSAAARSVGPAFAGLLIGLIGAGPTLILNVLAFAGLWIVVALWPGHSPAARAPGAAAGIGDALREGLRFARDDRAFCALLIQVFACFLGVGAVLGLLPSFVDARFGGGASARQLGALLSAYGAGSVLGSLAVAPLMRRFGRMHLVWGGTLLCGSSMLLLASARAPALLGLALLAAGFSWSVALTCVNISAQLLLPRGLLARGLSLSMTALMVSLAAGSVTWGALANALGVERAITAAGAAAIGWVLLQAFRELRGR